MKEFSLTYLVSILSVFISSATAVFLSIIAYNQNKKLNIQKEEHDKISGVEGSWEKTVNSVKFLKKLGKRVVVVIVATKYNIHNTELNLKVDVI